MAQNDRYKGTVGARATVTIEVFGLGAWGSTYTMDQIIDQARQSAEGIVRSAFAKEAERVGIKDVKVTAVYAMQEKD